MAILRKKAKHSGLKRLAIGASVVGAFVAGAAAGIKKDKVKAFARKTGLMLKSKVRRAKTAVLDKAADVQDRILT